MGEVGTDDEGQKMHRHPDCEAAPDKCLGFEHHGHRCMGSCEMAEQSSADSQKHQAIPIAAEDLERLREDAARWNKHIADPKVWRKLFEKAPCPFCGYNSHDYYQPAFHFCAAKYHSLTDAITE